MDIKFELATYSPPSDTSMNYMDNYMQLPEDSVPCKLRAKRGCATDPRSIAERVSSVNPFLLFQS
ncbi:unnamed protein product [Arabis nemorensis]|uniref:Uncharacterized protein n=1 Tax=Arabis nemorensis TaxID=586526 RepID=A0A565AX61_9BRAS|nr:unnamed protein product [Arabis nemorensis]